MENRSNQSERELEHKCFIEEIESYHQIFVIDRHDITHIQLIKNMGTSNTLVVKIVNFWRPVFVTVIEFSLLYQFDVRSNQHSTDCETIGDNGHKNKGFNNLRRSQRKNIYGTRLTRFQATIHEWK